MHTKTGRENSGMEWNGMEWRVHKWREAKVGRTHFDGLTPISPTWGPLFVFFFFLLMASLGNWSSFLSFSLSVIKKEKTT